VILKAYPVENKLVQHKQTWLNGVSSMEYIRYRNKFLTIDLSKGDLDDH